MKGMTFPLDKLMKERPSKRMIYTQGETGREREREQKEQKKRRERERDRERERQRENRR